MSSRVRDPGSAEKDKSDRKERKHKHRDREREGKSRHRTADNPVEELGGSQSRKEKDRVGVVTCLLALSSVYCLSCVADVNLAIWHILHTCTFLAGPRAASKQAQRKSRQQTERES